MIIYSSSCHEADVELCWESRKKEIRISFHVMGHNKFASDWCFKLVTRLCRRTNVGNLYGIARVVNESARYVVSKKNWSKKSVHFDSSNTGISYAKEHCDT